MGTQNFKRRVGAWPRTRLGRRDSRQTPSFSQAWLSRCSRESSPPTGRVNSTQRPGVLSTYRLRTHVGPERQLATGGDQVHRRGLGVRPRTTPRPTKAKRVGPPRVAPFRVRSKTAARRTTRVRVTASLARSVPQAVFREVALAECSLRSAREGDVDTERDEASLQRGAWEQRRGRPPP